MIIPDDHAQLVTAYTVAGMAEVHSFTIGCYVDGVAPDAAAVADRFSDIWKNRMIATVANEVTIGETTAYYRQGTDLFVGISANGPYAGTLGTGACSPAVSWLVRKNTGLAGRKFRGRMFTPQPRDNDVDAAGAISSGTQTTINTKLAQVVTDMNDMGVFGYAIRPRLLHNDSTPPTNIVSLVLDPIVGTQRRRQR